MSSFPRAAEVRTHGLMLAQQTLLLPEPSLQLSSQKLLMISPPACSMYIAHQETLWPVTACLLAWVFFGAQPCAVGGPPTPILP